MQEHISLSERREYEIQCDSYPENGHKHLNVYITTYRIELIPLRKLKVNLMTTIVVKEASIIERVVIAALWLVVTARELRRTSDRPLGSIYL